ncbi:DUF4845 domain-containing protein [Congregibacter litoralis]|uniref:DUF4845 domain-containing protein n=1 Tax=Congregibacter litoralis KT71 TaxID=314285 RepID=A4A3U6_9GAMM|nr:DUF4845 domain-containing protein [Congregibacter litoralis]EAQ99369.2 hypothetical protein KT71_16906 [Congregibacter litoralis KT71]
MKTNNRQQGMGMLGMLIIAVMVGFFVMSGIRIAPGLIEYQTVRELVIEAAEEFDDEEDTIADIRRQLSGSFNMNQIKSIGPRDVDITRENGKVVLNANYEDRIPLFWRIDAVVKYDDLVFIAGERYSDD